MRRTNLLLLCSALLAVAAPPAAAQAPSVTAALDECRTSGAAMGRYAIFRAEMEAVPRSDRMAMRFDLFVREPGDETFSRVAAPGLGAWIRSSPKVGRFIYRKQVTNLAAPAEYRSRVVFRWFDADGRVVSRTARRTTTCRQPDQRAELELGSPATAAGPQPGLLRYSLPVRNTGRGEAAPVEVALRIGPEDRQPVTVSSLAAGATQTVSFVAPACAPGETLRFEVDPDDRVEEPDERHNVLSIACPA